MAINDTSPERRNLILISIGFILFHFAGGVFTDATVKVMVVNLTFTKPHVLVVFSWILLFWLGLRFWQKFGFSFWNSISHEILTKDIPKEFQEYAAIEANKQLVGAYKSDHENKRVSAKRFSITDSQFFIVCNFTDDLGSTSYHQELVKPKKIRLIIYFFKQIIIHSVKGNTFAEELIPYLLFLGAVLSPFLSKWV